MILGALVILCGFLWVRSHGYNSKLQVQIEASPEQVFKHLRSPEAIRKWMPKPEKLNSSGVTMDLSNPNITSYVENIYVRTENECGFLGVSNGTWMLKSDTDNQMMITVNFSHKMSYTPMSFLFGSGLENAADVAYGRALLALKNHVEAEAKNR